MKKLRTCSRVEKLSGINPYFCLADSLLCSLPSTFRALVVSPLPDMADGSDGRLLADDDLLPLDELSDDRRLRTETSCLRF